MNKQTIARLASAAILLAGLGVTSAFGQPFNTTGTTSVAVAVSPEASIRIDTGTTTLLTVGGLFADYGATTNFTYRVRTTTSGSVTLKITPDFSPTGGPSVTTPPTAGDALTYTCAISGTGATPCSSGTASTSASTNVATFAADAHSVRDGSPGSVAWTLTNDPVYKTGSYSATATFTISTT